MITIALSRISLSLVTLTLSCFSLPTLYSIESSLPPAADEVVLLIPPDPLAEAEAFSSAVSSLSCNQVIALAVPKAVAKRYACLVSNGSRARQVCMTVGSQWGRAFPHRANASCSCCSTLRVSFCETNSSFSRGTVHSSNCSRLPPSSPERSKIWNVCDSSFPLKVILLIEALTRPPT